MTEAGNAPRPITLADLRAKLARSMAVLDGKEAHIAESFRRLVAAAVGHAFSARVVEMIIASSESTGQPHGLPYTEESLTAEQRRIERDLRRAAGLLASAKREIASARAQGREEARMLDELEAEARRQRTRDTGAGLRAPKQMQTRRRRRRPRR